MLQIVLYIYIFIVMAMARYNVTAANWSAFESCAVSNMPLAVGLSLRFTRFILINKFVSLSREQEAWIRSQLRSILSCLMEKMTVVTDPNAWFILTWIVEDLEKICSDVSRAHEMHQYFPETLKLLLALTSLSAKSAQDEFAYLFR